MYTLHCFWVALQMLAWANLGTVSACAADFFRATDEHALSLGCCCVYALSWYALVYIAGCEAIAPLLDRAML
jgi:hypothetical protein